MSSPDQVVQGTDYSFSQKMTPNDNDVSNFTYQLDVKQFPDDPATISKAITDVECFTDTDGKKILIVSGSLTPAETALLSVNLWYLIFTGSDLPDEDIQETQRIEIKKTWV